MPQMSPCSWVTLLILTNFVMNLIKMNIFFEKKF